MNEIMEIEACNSAQGLKNGNINRIVKLGRNVNSQFCFINHIKSYTSIHTNIFRYHINVKRSDVTR